MESRAKLTLAEKQLLQADRSFSGFVLGTALEDGLVEGLSNEDFLAAVSVGVSVRNANNLRRFLDHDEID
jgi:hypothetical protein